MLYNLRTRVVMQNRYLVRLLGLRLRHDRIKTQSQSPNLTLNSPVVAGAAVRVPWSLASRLTDPNIQCRRSEDRTLEVSC